MDSLDSQEVPLPNIDFDLNPSANYTPEAMLNVMSIGKRKRLESDVDNDQDLYNRWPVLKLCSHVVQAGSIRKMKAHFGAGADLSL